MSAATKKINHSTRVFTEAAELLNRHANVIKSTVLEDKSMQSKVDFLTLAKIEYDQYKRVAKELLNIAKVEQ